MRKKQVSKTDIKRFNPEFKTGLNSDEVSSRNEQRLNNKVKIAVGKSTWEIIRTDVLSLFNVMLIVLGALIIFGNVYDSSPNTKWYSGTFFLGIVIFNLVLTLYQDFKAKHLMKKMKLLTTPNARVIRDGAEMLIKPEEIVLDDILFLQSGDQICADSIIVSGEVYVNESLLTGESNDVVKKAGDTIFSGTFITSGSCYSKVEHVGSENYIETLSEKARAFRRNPSKILKSLKKLFRILGILIVTLVVIICTTYAIQGAFASFNSFINIISPLGAQFVAMIPAGLYLLTSVTLATGVIALYKKRANVQDFYSIEMLARADVLCVDKTGTITDEKMVVNTIKILSKDSKEEIGNIIANIMTDTNSNNATALALLDEFIIRKKLNPIKTIPFNSVNKYSAVTFDKDGTYLIGAAEYMNLENKILVEKDIEEYSKQGLRVLVLAKGTKEISGEKYDDKVTAIAIVVLQSHIKENAYETFKWFEKNGVQIKVISGDNALAVSQIAIEAGVEDAHKYISLEGMSIEDVKKVATEYNVFGRVTPEQKEALILALKEANYTVAMTGDGANDMLALKRADCSIAMNSGAQAAKNVSHIVLLDNDFSTMPEIVAEGRRVINNVERTGSLFLTKTFFAIVLSVTFWIVSICTANKYSYPFAPSNLIVWEVFGYGMTAFFISLERNPEPISKEFLRSILRKAIPCAIILLLGVGIVYLCFVLQNNNICFTGVDNFGFDVNNPRLPRTGATAIAILVFTTLSLPILYNTCKPINKYRGVVIGCAVVCSALSFLIAAFIPNNLFLIDFQSLTNVNLVLWACIAVILSTVIYFINPITNFIVDIFNKLKNAIKNRREKSHEN